MTSSRRRRAGRRVLINLDLHWEEPVVGFGSTDDPVPYARWQDGERGHMGCMKYW